LSPLADRIREIVGTGNAAVSRRPGSGESSVAHLESRDLSRLGGTQRGDCFVVERRLAREARHGCETIGAIAERLAHGAPYAPLFAADAPARPPFLFFDLETTGLSGGAGTQAFLVGCGSFHADGSFEVRQFLLTRIGDERPLLETVGEVLNGAGALVTFNGKSFDAPLLETRYLFHRLDWSAGHVPHVDVLHPARRFWNLDDCSLASLEKHVVGARRVGDVDGFEVPSRYFQFVRTGNVQPLVAVLEHNRLDLLTLAALASRLFHFARTGSAGVRTAREALAIGHVFARAGMDTQAREAFERAIALSAAPPGAFDATKIDALRALAVAWRRVRRFDDAARCWEQLLAIRGCPPIVAREANEALAIHHEHRIRDLNAAKTFALKGLDSAQPHASVTWTRAVHHRLARLDRKIGRVESLRFDV
jgi:uncharacterized protein YprB with RNaseH-like and TPR domain